MIKKVIFDLDNTLLMWKDEYIFALSNVLKKLNFNLDKDKIIEIDTAIVDYENFNQMYNNKRFLDFINTRCNIDLPLEFVDMLIKEQTNCFDVYSEEQKEVLEYLSKKYELIVISNWFTYTQVERLRNAGILKYFKIVTGGDEHEFKPSLKAFDIVEKPKECVMIGDSLKHDIEPALKLGMQAVLLTNKPIEKDLRYKKIKNLIELKEIL